MHVAMLNINRAQPEHACQPVGPALLDSARPPFDANGRRGCCIGFVVDVFCPLKAVTPLFGSEPLKSDVPATTQKWRDGTRSTKVDNVFEPLGSSTRRSTSTVLLIEIQLRQSDVDPIKRWHDGSSEQQTIKPLPLWLSVTNIAQETGQLSYLKSFLRFGFPKARIECFQLCLGREKNVAFVWHHEFPRRDSTTGELVKHPRSDPSNANPLIAPSGILREAQYIANSPTRETLGVGAKNFDHSFRPALKVVSRKAKRNRPFTGDFRQKGVTRLVSFNVPELNRKAVGSGPEYQSTRSSPTNNHVNLFAPLTISRIVLDRLQRLSAGGAA